MVDHKLLLSKLEAKKLDRTLVQWFQCYLTDRTQFLTLKGQSLSCRATYSRPLYMLQSRTYCVLGRALLSSLIAKTVTCEHRSITQNQE